jgi:hypothetical protein
MCERLLVRENGEPWAGDAAKLRSAQLQKLRKYLETEELQPTYEHVLCAASIQAYCDDGETAASDGSISSMADTAIRLLRSLDSENQELPRLEELKTQAEHRARERSAQRNAECPIFGVFTGAKSVPAWTEAMPVDATLTTVSQCTWMLLQIGVCPSRERMLQGLRCCDTASFDAKVSHAARVDGEPPATLVCENYVPKTLVLGLHPSGGPRSKNAFYATVDLDTPILPEAAHLLPVVRGGLARLCQGLEDGARVFRREEDNRHGTTFGRNQLGSLFTKTFGHSCGVLRKAVEQRAEGLYRTGDLSLDQCSEVHRRCQHKGDTALQKYVLRLQNMETDVSDAEALPEPADEDEDEDEPAPPPRRRLVRQRAVEDDVDLDLPEEPDETEEPDEPEAPEEPEGTESGDGSGDGSGDESGDDGVALVVRMANGSAHMFHQTVFAAAYLVDTGGRDLSRADTAFDDGTLQVTWDEGAVGVFPAITDPT